MPQERAFANAYLPLGTLKVAEMRDLTAYHNVVGEPTFVAKIACCYCQQNYLVSTWGSGLLTASQKKNP